MNKYLPSLPAKFGGGKGAQAESALVAPGTIVHLQPPSTYTPLHRSRKKRNASVTGDSTYDYSSFRSSPPYPFRYDHTGGSSLTASGMGEAVVGLEGDEAGLTHQIAVAHDVTMDDLPGDCRRVITQSAVMDNVSPNTAARELGFPCPHRLSWEWLHLIAFSISPTHVPALSPKP